MSDSCGAANDESVVVGESTDVDSANGQHFINQIDSDNIESAVSVSSDENAGQIENIQNEANHSELTGAIEPLETMEIEFEGILFSPHFDWHLLYFVIPVLIQIMSRNRITLKLNHPMMIKSFNPQFKFLMRFPMNL